MKATDRRAPHETFQVYGHFLEHQDDARSKVEEYSMSGGASPLSRCAVPPNAVRPAPFAFAPQSERWKGQLERHPAQACQLIPHARVDKIPWQQLQNMMLYVPPIELIEGQNMRTIDAKTRTPSSRNVTLARPLRILVAADTLAPEIPRPRGMALDDFLPEVQRFFGCVRMHPEYSAGREQWSASTP